MIVDTIGPRLSLLGGESVTIAVGSTFNDVGAIATDLSFDSDIIVYSTDSVDTSNSHTVTISYTAQDDDLGNSGETIFRTVHVVYAEELKLKKAFDATAAGTLDSTLRIKDPTHASTFKIGALTYAGISNFHGLTIVDITDIAAPQQVTVYDVRSVENISSVVTFTTFTEVNGFSYSDGNETIYVPNTRFAVSLHDADIVFINISDVTFPSYHTNITDDGIEYPELDGSKQIVIGGGYTGTLSPFAIVAASDDDGVQLMSLHFLSHPNVLSPFNLSSVSDGDGFSLGGARSVAVIDIDSSKYALVAAYDDNSVQILDISNPSAPTSAAIVTDGQDGYDELQNPNFVTTVTIDSSHYALVASPSDSGVQIIDITDPDNPIAASSFSSNRAPFGKLAAPNSIATIQIATSTYALITAHGDLGVRFVDITDPYNPIEGSFIQDNTDGYTALTHPSTIVTTTIDSSIYALITSMM